MIIFNEIHLQECVVMIVIGLDDKHEICKKCSMFHDY